MFSHEIRNSIAWVTFDSGGMNTLSAAAVEGLARVVAELTHAYVRAAPGTLLDSTYDAATGALSVHATAAPAGGEVLAFYPAALHGAPTLTSSGLLDVRTTPAPSDGLYISAHTAGGDWSLATQ